ncbi:MAG: hypothetical protein RJA70_2278 [Pseudomonadota bacterium]|jgi:23S rRNA pseudouridine1911/1915/1917 synthase
MLRVPPELAGMRLDVFLAMSLRATSRTRAKKIALSAAFSTVGQRIRPNQRMKAEEHVVLWRVASDSADEELEMPELYRDEHLLVINKPPNITVHPTASHYNNTVTKLLESREPGQFFRLIHRLDRDTSGILLIALTPEADRAFKRLLEGTLDLPIGKSDHVQKTYRCITWGVPQDGLIDLPIERDENNSLRVKMKVSAPGRGLPSQTRVIVEERCEGYALVRCELLTGRQHQIRIHLASLGTPVVGDKLYGPDERMHARGADGKLTLDDLERLEMPRQALHAAKYELLHAITWQPLVVEAPLPPDMEQFWRERSAAKAD